MEELNENISLAKLAKLEDLSVRTMNVCEGHSLTDLITILNFYWENKNFLKFRNCGNKSNIELVELCLKYENLISKQGYYIKAENPIEKKIDSLSVRQIMTLNILIEDISEKLSARSLNAIKNFTDQKLTIMGLKDILIDPEYDLNKIQNIGKKTAKELVQFFIGIREQIELVHLNQNEYEKKIMLISANLKRKLQINLEDMREIWKNYRHEYVFSVFIMLFSTDINRGLYINSEDFAKICKKHKDEGGFPVFKTIDVLISNGYLYEGKELEILWRTFNFWTDSEPETLEKIGSNIGITRERTRQIRKHILDRFNSTFSFLKGLEIEILNLYGLDTEADIITIDDELIEKIQQKEKISFNIIFITKILSIILNKTHSLVGNFENCVFRRVKNSIDTYILNSIYLIKNEAKEYIDFELLAADVNKRLSERIDEDYSFHFEAYLTNFQKKDLFSASIDMTQIAENILFKEFEIIIDSYGQITFKRNTKKQVAEFIYEVLKERNEPLNIYQIYDLLVIKHPNITKSAESLRGICQRDPNLIYFGRSSTYGLRIWEEKETIKGGTMHDIAEEFLIDYETPKHIDEITAYVSKYRPKVTSKNLWYNLKSAENRRFRFFEDYNIGLVGKQYKEAHIQTNRPNVFRRRWEENFELLSAFINEFKSLPYPSGERDEQRLYRFMNVQLNKAKNVKLDNKQRKKIDDLISKYSSQKRKRKSSKVNKSSYEELISFIHENKRLPKANDINEKDLYQFFYRQSKLFGYGKLNSEQECYYNKIINLIEYFNGHRNYKK